MKKLSIDDVEPTSENGIDRRKLTDSLNTAHVALNRYVLEPGERLGGLHAHMDQEEVFIVIEGEATFETMDGEVTVGEDEGIRFAPGEFQSGKNDADERMMTFALGAPRDSEDVRIPLACPECGHDDRRLTVVEDREVLVCPDCGNESDASCPECGQYEMHATLSESEEKAVGVCRNCGAESAG